MNQVITRDGTQLYVKEWGSGRPVILMHGWPLSADSWDDQAMAIADAGMRAIAYDRRYQEIDERNRDPRAHLLLE